MDDRLSQALLRVLLVTAQKIRYIIDRSLAEDGLSSAQVFLLAAIEASPEDEPPSLGEVAARMATSHQNAKQLAMALARKGFVSLEPDPSDRRVRRLRTTPANAAYWAQKDPAEAATVRGFFSALSPDEAPLVLDALERIGASVDDQYQAVRSTGRPG